MLAACLPSFHAGAHYCGPPVIRCKPGDIITYYIVSDRAEQGFSNFGVNSQSRPDVAPVVYFTPVGWIYGQYVIEAQQVGTNNIILSWDFPPNGASGICFVEVRVSTNHTTSTAGNSPWSAYEGDPVNAFTGELVIQEPPDLYLGGPLPLHFSRYYASRLQADSLFNSRLGDNWSHNFEWSAILGLTNRAIIVSPQGLNVRFQRSGTNWVLQSPTYLPFQLVDSGTNVIFGDPRLNLLYTFNTNGLLRSISDGKGNAHTLTYTDDRLLSQVSDGLGRTLTFNYVGAQLLNRVSDGIREARFIVHEFGNEFNLVRVTNVLGQATTYTYDNFKSVGSLLTSTIYPAGNTGYSQSYDSEGRVIQQSRLGTNITRFAYSTNSFTTYVTNAAGHLTVYSHSPDGNLLGIADAAGLSLTVSTNAQGRRAGITDRTGASVKAAFNAAAGLPSAITNADGSLTLFTYTNRVVSGITLNELASVTLPDGFTQRFTYDAAGNMVAFQDRAGNIARFGYNARGQLLASTNSSGGVTTFTYNADGTTATRTEPELGTVTFQHDALRRVTNAIAADGRSIGVTLDAADRIAKIIDERTNTTSFAFDANHRLTAITNALQQVTRFNYDPADRISGIVDRFGRTIGYAYDALDRVTAFTNRNGNVTQLTWDPRGRMAGIVDAAGKARTFGYNNENLLVSFTNALGHQTSVRRDSAGFVTAITNALGKVTFLNRDALARIESSINPLGHLDRYHYEPRSHLTNANRSALGPAVGIFNELGAMTRLIDQGGSQWRFNYSAMGRLTNSVDPLNRTNSVSYDSRGRPKRFAFADGASQTNSYDASGNLTRLDFSDGINVSFDHDALNRVTNTAGIALAYDLEDRVTNTVSSGINFGAAFDAGGRLTNVTYNGGAFSVAYSYDSRDRLTRVRDSLANGQIDFFYDDAGRLTNVTRANGVSGIYDHDALGKLKRIREGSFIDLNYEYDAAGLLSSLAATTPLPFAPTTPQTNGFDFDAAHQVSSGGYVYDARGRLTTMPGIACAWNAASQLTRAGNVTNTFNGFGNLLTRATAGGTTRFHYNHALNRVPIVAEQNAVNSQFQRYYVWTPDGRLLYAIDATAGNAVAYYHFDLNGSTLALTSAAGAVTDAYAYTPYGVVLARTGTSTQPFTYVGRHGVRWDSGAQLYQMRARFYDPVTTRFLSRDPLWPALADSVSLNPYGYVANNPLQFVDPLGTRTEVDASQPVSVLGREEISRIGGENIADVLNGLKSAPDGSSSLQGINLRGLGRDRTLVLLNGLRAQPGERNPDSIPVSEIERVEILRDGASAIYGSDAVAGVVNVILRQPSTELNYLNLNAGEQFEPKINAGFNFTPADGPLEVPIVQPARSRGQLNLFMLSTESLVMNSYGMMLQRPYFGLRPSGEMLDRINLMRMMAGNPPAFVPRGTAFVNGRFVSPKVSDIVYGLWLQWNYYEAISRIRIPQTLYPGLLDCLDSGGSGGAWANDSTFTPNITFRY